MSPGYPGYHFSHLFFSFGSDILLAFSAYMIPFALEINIIFVLFLASRDDESFRTAMWRS